MWTKINISLSLIFFSLSLLIWDHYLPWTAFSNEFFACLGLCFLAFSVFGSQIRIPYIALPLLGIVFIPVIQYAIGLIHFSSNAFLCFGYLAIGFISVILGYLFADQHKSNEFYKWFCIISLFTGVITSLIAILQWLKLEHHFFFIFEMLGNRPYGNLAQPNNMATALLVSWIGTIYLFEIRNIRPPIYYATSILILFAVALSQSRTSWIAIPAVSFYLLYSKDIFSKLNKINFILPVLFYILSVISLPFFRNILGQLFHLTPLQTMTISERASTGFQRLQMWEQTLQMIALHPWRGSGWNQSIWSEVELLLQHPIMVEGYYYSSHNIILDMWVWNGLILGSFITIYFIFWSYKILYSAKISAQVLGLAMIAIITIHALLEYPLYYANFLIPFGLLLGYTSSCIPNQRFIKVSKWISFPCCFLFFLAVMGIWRDYNRAIEQNTSAQLYDLMRSLKKSPEYGKMNDYKLQNNIYILDQLKYDYQWLALNPFVKVSQSDIELYRQLTIYRPIPSKLIKLGQLSLYNNNESGYEFSRKLLKNMYGIKVTKNDLIKNDLISIANNSIKGG